MLRASCENNNIEIDLAYVVNGTAKCEVEHADLLIAFADAILTTAPDSESGLQEIRNQVVKSLGEARMFRAAGVVANFQMMNRALDVLGAQFGREVSPAVVDMAATLDMQIPVHWGK